MPKSTRFASAKPVTRVAAPVRTNTSLAKAIAKTRPKKFLRTPVKAKA